MYLFLYTCIHTYAIVLSMMRGIPASLLVSSARATHIHTHTHTLTHSLSHTGEPKLHKYTCTQIHTRIRIHVYKYMYLYIHVHDKYMCTCTQRTLPASLVMSARARISETTPPGFARLSAHRSFTLGLLHALRTCQRILNSQRHIKITI